MRNILLLNMFLCLLINAIAIASCDGLKKVAGDTHSEQRQIHFGNYFNHDAWRGTDTRLARYKEIGDLPKNIVSQMDLDIYVKQTIGKRKTVDGERVELPASNSVVGQSKIGKPVYRYITSAEDGAQFAKSLVDAGVNPKDVYKKDGITPVFEAGKAYEDIKAQNYDQIVGSNNQGLNTATTLAAARLVQSLLTHTPTTVEHYQNYLEYNADRLHLNWLGRPENAWVTSDPTNDMNGNYFKDLSRSGPKEALREKDLIPIGIAVEALGNQLSPEQRNILQAAKEQLLQRYALEARLFEINEERVKKGLPRLNEYIPGNTELKSGFAYLERPGAKPQRVKVISSTYPDEYEARLSSDNILVLQLVDENGNPSPKTAPYLTGYDFEFSFVNPPWLLE